MNDQVWAEIQKALGMIAVPEPEPLEFRLHYDDDGKIFMCSMQQHPENTKYLVVTREEYDHYYLYRVEDGKLKMIDRNMGLHVKLKTSDQGYATVKNHASIILEPGETADVEYWEG